MSHRIAFSTVSPEPYKLQVRIEAYLRESGFDRRLLELVRLRASQINGCGYCIDMHWKDARAAGETEERLYGLSAFRECPWYDDREKAALAWTEAVTRLPGGLPPPDDVRAEADRHFSEKELVDLTWAICTINSWNRLCVAFHSEVGSYQPADARHP